MFSGSKIALKDRQIKKGYLRALANIVTFFLMIYKVKKLQRFNNIKGLTPNDLCVGVPEKFLPTKVVFDYLGECFNFYAENKNTLPSITIEMIDKNDKSKTYPVVFFKLDKEKLNSMLSVPVNY